MSQNTKQKLNAFRCKDIIEDLISKDTAKIVIAKTLNIQIATLESYLKILGIKYSG